MAIQLRRGVYADFDPGKMVAGEIAFVTAGDPNSESGQSVYACFSPGIVKRFAAYEEMVENINAATEEIQQMFTADVQQAILLATQATNTANAAAETAGSAAEAANEAAALANAAAAGDISEKTVTFTEDEGELESGLALKNLFGRTKRKLSNLFSNIGALADLLTTDKSNLVAAINALKLVTDGKVDASKALNTYAEIMAATEAGFWPDALAVKEGFNQVNSTTLTVSRALVSDTAGKVAASAVTATELEYLDGVTSNVQTQLNAKQAASSAIKVKTTYREYTVDAGTIRTVTPTEADFTGGTVVAVIPLLVAASSGYTNTKIILGVADNRTSMTMWSSVAQSLYVVAVFLYR